MEKAHRPNRLAELLREGNGFVLIEDAVALLGASEYTRCLIELCEKDEDDPESIDLFFQKGDSQSLVGEPTHLCFSEAFFERICDYLDESLEGMGHLSPRTKGFLVN